MRRGTSPAAHALLIALLIALLAGCGGSESESGLAIRFSNSALLDRASQVFVYFYNTGTPCQLVRQTVPRPPAVLGPFQAPVTPDGRTRGISFKLDMIPVGTYVVFADAEDENGANVGSGCAPEQQIIEKELSKIQVVVSEEG